jgi:intracellular sulfur oxidation DsrE/DsrF family protein
LSRWYLFLPLVFCLQFSAGAETDETPSDAETESVPTGYVFGVTVSSVQELDVILNRADSLRKLFDPDQHGRIAIVLHGDELQLFQKDNYAANQSIVDRARLLDEEMVIDIKACQTQMRFLEIEQSELPGFIEQVPFAPVEIERLEKEQGFTRL